ncbi:urease accessory protein UreD [Hahella ganghwensis]|uniref:urease accessory protein UreD n=1 Tax=Hahella ganghwensis TaxID=286420 RepID=UPI000377B49F|nr:urease accessory protein UreD [Hahella ganghwensis]
MNITEQIEISDRVEHIDYPTHNAVAAHQQNKTTTREWAALLDIIAKGRTSESGLLSRTSIIQARHQGPLRIQRPFYPEGPSRPHLYLLHPPGGLVCGDHLSINIALEDQARLLVTTPSAGKIYRTDQYGHLQQQDINIDCTSNAHIEWLPQENIIYDGANGEQRLTLNTRTDSAFFLWDITAMGRPATNAPFKRGTFIQKLNILKEGIPYFHERVHLEDAGPNFTAPWGLNRLPVYGSLFAGYVEESQQLLESLRHHLNELITGGINGCMPNIDLTQAAMVWSATRRDNIIILRALAAQSEPVKALFTEAWHFMRPDIMGGPASMPRIWAT